MMTTDKLTDTNQQHLWRLLWEYAPNGMIVMDADLYVKLVNPAFCQMFQLLPSDILGQPITVIFEDTHDLEKVWNEGIVIRGKAVEYPQYNLYVNQVIFPIEDEGIIACIFVDLSHELDRRRELKRLKRETVKKVNEVVDNQMKVVQEIAGLLGETTAETKVSLLKIIQMLEQE
ncbi:MAG: PAS domain-containing protein [Elainellaceae cyanobacterium]